MKIVKQWIVLLSFGCLSFSYASLYIHKAALDATCEKDQVTTVVAYAMANDLIKEIKQEKKDTGLVEKIASVFFARKSND